MTQLLPTPAASSNPNTIDPQADGVLLTAVKELYSYILEGNKTDPALRKKMCEIASNAITIATAKPDPQLPINQQSDGDLLYRVRVTRDETSTAYINVFANSTETAAELALDHATTPDCTGFEPDDNMFTRDSVYLGGGVDEDVEVVPAPRSKSANRPKM